MLEATRRLKDLERRKRTVAIGSRDFQQLADEIAEISREIFNTSDEQTVMEDAFARHDRTIDNERR